MSEPPMQEMIDNLQAVADEQPMTVYCDFCPEWSASGTAGETRAEAETHRKETHPETFTKKKLVKRRRVFSQALTSERQTEIDEERRQRMRSLGMI